MSLQMLISAVGQEPHALIEKMKPECDCILVNQKQPYAYEEFGYKGHQIRSFSMQEQGVGLSRNHALLRAEDELCLFADEDIVYDEGYAARICEAFETHPEADMLLFNVRVDESRRTYWTDRFHRVRLYNCGRYPAYSFAMRTEKLHAHNLTYHLWFGGGARYSNGEDSLFISDCIRSGLSVYAVPIEIGAEIPRPSTWFEGYTDKFFYDRGVLYHYLYGRLAPVMATRFLWKHGAIMCKDFSRQRARMLMRAGYTGRPMPQE